MNQNFGISTKCEVDANFVVILDGKLWEFSKNGKGKSFHLEDIVSIKENRLNTKFKHKLSGDNNYCNKIIEIKTIEKNGLSEILSNNLNSDIENIDHLTKQVKILLEKLEEKSRDLKLKQLRMTNNPNIKNFRHKMGDVLLNNDTDTSMPILSPQNIINNCKPNKVGSPSNSTNMPTLLPYYNSPNKICVTLDKDNIAHCSFHLSPIIKLKPLPASLIDYYNQNINMSSKRKNSEKNVNLNCKKPKISLGNKQDKKNDLTEKNLEGKINKSVLLKQSKDKKLLKSKKIELKNKKNVSAPKKSKILDSSKASKILDSSKESKINKKRSKPIKEKSPLPKKKSKIGVKENDSKKEKIASPKKNSKINTKKISKKQKTPSPNRGPKNNVKTNKSKKEKTPLVKKKNKINLKTNDSKRGKSLSPKKSNNEKINKLKKSKSLTPQKDNKNNAQVNKLSSKNKGSSKINEKSDDKVREVSKKTSQSSKKSNQILSSTGNKKMKSKKFNSSFIPRGPLIVKSSLWSIREPHDASPEFIKSLDFNSNLPSKEKNCNKKSSESKIETSNYSGIFGNISQSSNQLDTHSTSEVSIIEGIQDISSSSTSTEYLTPEQSPILSSQSTSYMSPVSKDNKETDIFGIESFLSPY